MDHLRQKLIVTRWIYTAAAGVLLAAVVACAKTGASATVDSARSDSVARAKQDSINRAQPGYVVDSIFPIEEEIRRFNAGLNDPGKLTGGGSSPGELVRKFTAALARRDTSALRSLLVSRAEFGYFVFPESPFTRAPYKTKPGLIWLQLMSASERGLPRLVQRVGGDSIRVSDLQCDRIPEHQGPNRYWRNCSLVVHTADAGARRLQLFGQILERDGRAKFLSYESAF